MTEVAEHTGQTAPQTPTETDLVAAVTRVLEASEEPLTLSKIRAHLPAAFRGVDLEVLHDSLRRRVEANVLYTYCPYRSQQPRFWDRPMPVHVAALVRVALADGPLTWSQLRRKLPDYARNQAREVLKDQLDQGKLYRHPQLASRTGERFGLQAPDAREPLRAELARLFDRLQQQLGFSQEQLRLAALDLLHEQEWGPGHPAARTAAPPAAPGHEKPAAPGRESPAATEEAEEEAEADEEPEVHAPRPTHTGPHATGSQTTAHPHEDATSQNP
jgi:hypothetical protein